MNNIVILLHLLFFLAFPCHPSDSVNSQLDDLAIGQDGGGGGAVIRCNPADDGDGKDDRLSGVVMEEEIDEDSPHQSPILNRVLQRDSSTKEADPSGRIFR